MKCGFPVAAEERARFQRAVLEAIYRVDGLNCVIKEDGYMYSALDRNQKFGSGNDSCRIETDGGGKDVRSAPAA